MILSLGIIFVLGIFMGKLFGFFKLPPLTGMIIAGVIIGPYALGFLDEKIMYISSELRKLALIIILMRAGLNLDIRDLKKVGREAFLMCFVPAAFEIIAFTIFAPMVLGVSALEGAILGTVIAAVSPAVIVPKMIKLIEEGYGKKHSIPQLIMAGASVDDIFVIVLFTAVTAIGGGTAVSGFSLVKIPISIVLGIVIGVCLGFAINYVFRIIKMDVGLKVIVLMGLSCLVVGAEDYFQEAISFSGLLAVMSMGVTLQMKWGEKSKEVSSKFTKIWQCAEVLLFVLVGATVNMEYALNAGIGVISIIIIGLSFRIIGVFVSLFAGTLTKKERLFCVIAYLPKATVQAAIGAIPLSMGLACGDIVLVVAVVSILLMAPIGAFLIDYSYKKLLEQ